MTVTLREFHMDDVPGLVPLRVAVEETDHLGLFTSAEDVRQACTRPTWQPEQNSFVAVAPDGQIVGNSWLVVRHGVNEVMFNLHGHVHPAWRGRGIGQQLLDAVLARARERIGEAGGQHSWLQSGGVHDAPQDGGRIALFEKNGFELARWGVDMRRELPGLGKIAPIIPIVQEPAGIRLRKWRAGVDDEAVGWLLNDAFQDSWNYTQIVMDEWFHYLRSGWMDFEHSVLAWDAANERMAGACVNVCNERTFQRRGRRELYVDDLAVRREYRKRGVATALLAWTLNRADHMGMQSVALDADAENPTGAVRLYTRLGFEIISKTRVYRQELVA
jgi:mycothiol synthase